MTTTARDKALEEKPKLCPGCGRPGGYSTKDGNDHWHWHCLRRQFPKVADRVISGLSRLLKEEA